MQHLNAISPFLHARRRVYLALRSARIRRRRSSASSIPSGSRLRSPMHLDRTPSHPDTKEPAQPARQQHIQLTKSRTRAFSNLLQNKRQHQHQRTERRSRARSSAHSHARHDQHGKPEDDFEAIENSVRFRARPFPEMVVVLRQHLVGDDEEGFDALCFGQISVKLCIVVQLALDTAPACGYDRSVPFFHFILPSLWRLYLLLLREGS